MNAQSATVELPLKTHADGFCYLTMMECREHPFALDFVETFAECFEVDFVCAIFIFYPHGDAPADRRPRKDDWLRVAATNDRELRRTPGGCKGDGAP